MGSMDDVDSVHGDIPDNKRQKRNTSEKRRRDAFNKLITELHGIVSTGDRKLDKSNVLKQTISYLQTHNQSKSCDPSVNEERWKPAFLSHQEYACLLLDGLNAFVLVLTNAGNIIFASNELLRLTGSRKSLKGELIFDFLDHSSNVALRSMLSGEVLRAASSHPAHRNTQSVKTIDVKVVADLDGRKCRADVELTGKFRRLEISEEELSNLNPLNVGLSPSCDMLCLVSIGRVREPASLPSPLLSLSPSSSLENQEFTSVFNMEWKFISLDQKAISTIGYLQFEVLGNSGYDYYHPDDLDIIAEDHIKLKEEGQVVLRPFRFLSKGQNWIRLGGRAFVTHNQWNSKPEFVVSNNWAIRDDELAVEERRISSTTLATKQRGHSIVELDKGVTETKELKASKTLRPQPGVFIEHSPIPRPTRARMSRRAESDPSLLNHNPPLNPHLDDHGSSTPFPSASVVNEEGEGGSIRSEGESFESPERHVYQDLQQRQVNLQHQIMQQQQELLTLQQRLIKAPAASQTPVNPVPAPPIQFPPPLQSEGGYGGGHIHPGRHSQFQGYRPQIESTTVHSPILPLTTALGQAYSPVNTFQGPSLNQGGMLLNQALLGDQLPTPQQTFHWTPRNP